MTGRSSPISIEITQPLDTMLHQILNQALVAIDAKAGSLMLVATKQGILQIKARLGPPRPGRVTERVLKVADNSIAGWVVRNKQSYVCSEVDSDDLFLASRSGPNFVSLLSVPIVHNGKVIAVINADSEEPGRFTDDHRKVLERVAKQVARPIADRISITDALAEVGVELTRLPREGGVDRVLDKICELAVRSLGADVVTLYQYDQDRDKFLVEGTGPTIGGLIKDSQVMRREVFPGDVPWTVVKERKPGFYMDVQKMGFLVGQANRPDGTPKVRFVDREGITSMAALLLPNSAAESKGEEVVGVMFANYRTRHEFNIDERSALATFADYAAAAILNARYEERRRADQIRMAHSISLNLAHRMSNLAGPCRIAAQTLRERIDPHDEEARSDLDMLENKADFLIGLATELVERIKSSGNIVDTASVPIGPLIEDELHRLTYDPGQVTVQRKIPAGLPDVETIEYQLRKIVSDVLDNALAAVAKQPHGEIRVVVRRHNRARRVVIEISDDGPGIPAEQRSQVFTLGFSTKRNTLGIGLWYGQEFLRSTGGKLSLKRTPPGKGTTFVIEVPFARPRTSATTEAPRALSQKDILIVENDPTWQASLSKILAGRGYSITVANDLAEASRLLDHTGFALAVVDLSLHEDPNNRDGLELLAQIDKRRLDTRVVIVTGHGDESDLAIASQSPRFVEMVRKGGLMLQDFRAIVDRSLRS